MKLKQCIKYLNIRFFLILLLVTAISNCNTKKNNTKQKVRKEIKTDTITFQKDNFINRNGRYDPNYIFVKNDIKRGGFMVLENGYDSIAIRLWYEYFEPRTQVVEIRKENKGWSAHFFTLKRAITSNNDTTVTIIRDTIIENPKSGWQAFTQKLFALNVTDLPTSSDIANYDPPSDGDFVNVEIATQSFYQLKYYPSPKSNIKIKEIKFLEDIMQLIEDEFGEKRIKKI